MHFSSAIVESKFITPLFLSIVNVGLAFAEDAIGYMVKRNIRIETQRDASLRADEIVGSMAYGVTELFDEYGVGIIGKGSLA